MSELVENPPRDIVNSTCLNCELLPTKPGQQTYPAWVIAAANAANRAEVLIETGRSAIVCDMSARVGAALEGVKSGRNKSEQVRFKEKPTAQPAASKNQLQSGEGVMDD
jgi:hypothetical protein